MRIFDAGGIKEIIYGSSAAAVCFGAPVFMKYMFPEPTALHGLVNDMPFLGCLFIGLTILRLWQRTRTLDEDEQNK